MFIILYFFLGISCLKLVAPFIVFLLYTNPPLVKNGFFYFSVIFPSIVLFRRIGFEISARNYKNVPFKPNEEFINTQ